MPDSQGNQPPGELLGIRHYLEDFRKGQAEVREVLNETKIQLARLDERQQETTRKVDAIGLSMTNHYVSGIEFGLLKKEVLDHKLYADKEREKIWDRLNDLEEARDSDRTWFIRTTLGGFILAALSLIGIKKGIM